MALEREVQSQLNRSFWLFVGTLLALVLFFVGPGYWQYQRKQSLQKKKEATAAATARKRRKAAASPVGTEVQASPQSNAESQGQQGQQGQQPRAPTQVRCNMGGVLEPGYGPHGKNGGPPTDG